MPAPLRLLLDQNGKVLSEPATEDLKTYPVRVESGEIFVGVPE
jgi:nitrite reductase/ring-hydroxylating ferredoxin subunit